MDDEKDKRPDSDWEALKLYFEFFKHFTTLTTAVGLILIALFRGLDLSTNTVVFGVGCLGVTLLLSLVGMLLMVMKAAHPEAGYKVRPGYPTFLLATFTVSFFFTGLLMFVSYARGVSPSDFFTF